jgi:dsRNA-specific ribonuclease
MPLSERQKKSLMIKITKKVDRNKLLADAVLAVIAAVHMDAGFDAVKRVVLNLGLFIEKKE